MQLEYLNWTKCGIKCGIKWIPNSRAAAGSNSSDIRTGACSSGGMGLVIDGPHFRDIVNRKIRHPPHCKAAMLD
jgi:hypothetical protein